MKKEERIKLIKKMLKFLFVLSFIAYLSLYISQKTGYYEYEIRQKKEFTEEQIRMFEEDLKQGKQIDMNAYLEYTNKDYQNNASKLTLSISEEIGKYTKMGIEAILTRISKLIE